MRNDTISQPGEVNLIHIITFYSINNERICNQMRYVSSWQAVSVLSLSSDRLSWRMGLYASPTSPKLTEAGTRVWPETSLEPPAAQEHWWWKVFLLLLQVFTTIPLRRGFKLLLRENDTSSSMKLIMKYIAVLCSRQFDRRISHPWFCQLWVIVHVAERGKPPPSIAVSEEYSVTSV